MNIAVGSAFRNSQGRMLRYFEQLTALIQHAGPLNHVRLIAAVGDCTDDTRGEVERRSVNAGVSLQFVKCDHGQRVFASTEEQDRLDALTIVGNAILGGVDETDDVLVYVESDLIWNPHTIGTLIDVAYERRDNFDIVAPMVMADKYFYDIFAFRKDGERFGPFFPYHGGLQVQGITEIDSAGSCLVMRAEIARKVRMPPGGVLIGFCNEARAAGYRVGVISNLTVNQL
jgi:hypothetical protein